MTADNTIRPVDVSQIRLECIRKAAAEGTPIKDDWAGWLAVGVSRVRAGGTVDEKWLAKQDASQTLRPPPQGTL